jgi:hypothetical protein
VQRLKMGYYTSKFDRASIYIILYSDKPINHDKPPNVWVSNIQATPYGFMMLYVFLEAIKELRQT